MEAFDLRCVAPFQVTCYLHVVYACILITCIYVNIVDIFYFITIMFVCMQIQCCYRLPIIYVCMYLSRSFTLPPIRRDACHYMSLYFVVSHSIS